MSEPIVDIHSILTKKELKTRKIWKFIFFSKVAFLVLAVLGGAVSVNGQEAEEFKTGVLFGAAAIPLISLFALYKCSYSSYGTKFITFVLFTSLMSIPQYFQGFMSSSSLRDQMFVGFELFFHCIFWIYSFQLRAMNKLIKAYSKNLIHLEGISSRLFNTTSKEDAYSQFKEELKNLPDAEPYIVREYNRKTKSLSGISE